MEVNRRQIFKAGVGFVAGASVVHYTGLVGPNGEKIVRNADGSYDTKIKPKFRIYQYKVTNIGTGAVVITKGRREKYTLPVNDVFTFKPEEDVYIVGDGEAVVHVLEQERADSPSGFYYKMRL
jgi:hypothetical protein